MHWKMENCKLAKEPVIYSSTVSFWFFRLISLFISDLCRLSIFLTLMKQVFFSNVYPVKHFLQFEFFLSRSESAAPSRGMFNCNISNSRMVILKWKFDYSILCLKDYVLMYSHDRATVENENIHYMLLHN